MIKTILIILSEEKESAKNNDFFCQWRIFLTTNFLATKFYVDDKFYR